MSRWDNICPACGKHRIWEHEVADSKACRKEMERRRKVKWPRRPVPNPVLRVKLDTGKSRLMTAAEWRQRQGQAKGGRNCQGGPNASRWTSTTAKAARMVQERKRTKWGLRIGRTSVIAPAVKRAPLRTRYAATPERGIEYHPDPTTGLGFWTRTTDQGATLVISEIAALRHLGHLPRPYRTSTGVPVDAGVVMSPPKGPRKR